jgi:hypothetical protein
MESDSSKEQGNEFKALLVELASISKLKEQRY